MEYFERGKRMPDDEDECLISRAGIHPDKGKGGALTLYIMFANWHSTSSLSNTCPFGGGFPPRSL